MADIPARYIGLGESTTGSRVLTDDEYKLFIRARIAKNHSRGTINEVVDAALFITGADDVELIDGVSEATMQLVFDELLDNNLKVFLSNNDLIPKAAGVKLDLIEYDGNNAFGYAGANNGNAKGYDDGIYATAF